MKRYILLLILLAAFVPSFARSFDGDFSVTRKVLAKRGDKLVMELEIVVSPNAVVRTTSWMIIPELSTADRRSLTLFPHIIVEGSYQKHLRKRRALFMRNWEEREPYRIISVRRRSKAEVIRYAVEVPYESWMQEASLVVRQIMTSKGDRRRVYTVDVNGAVEIEENASAK